MIDLLKVKSIVYDKARTLNCVYDAITLLIGLSFIIALSFLDSKILNAFSILFSALITVTVFLKAEIVSKYKIAGSNAQQFFDVYVLGINEPNELYRNIKYLSKEDISDEVDNYKIKTVAKQENWYANYENLSESNQILSCAKENIRWDNKLRKVYMCILIGAMVIIISCIGLFIFFSSSILHKAAAITWIMPLIVNIGSKICILNKDIVRLNNLKEQVDKADKLNTNERELYEEVCVIQSYIFKHRQKAYLIPKFIYNCKRNDLQHKANSIASMYNEEQNETRDKE